VLHRIVGRRAPRRADGTFDVGHPDVLEFIRAKRENGRLRQFNLSLLITDEFMQAVKSDGEWKLAFPLARNEYETERPDLSDTAKFVWREWPDARAMWRTRRPRRMQDLQDPAGAPGVGSHHVLHLRFREPGFILIDRVNEMNNNWWTETIRATNPCGEQPLPPYGSCLLARST